MSVTLSHLYQIGESTFILRGIRSNFSFLFQFSMIYLLSKRYSLNWDAAVLASHLGLFCLPMSPKKATQAYMSLVMKKPGFFHMRKQRRSYCAADQRLCFRYTDSTIPLLPISEISSIWPSSVAVQPGLCRTWSETPKTGFLTTRLIWDITEPISSTEDGICMLARYASCTSISIFSLSLCIDLVLSGGPKTWLRKTMN